jgi:hypothetical protein
MLLQQQQQVEQQLDISYVIINLSYQKVVFLNFIIQIVVLVNFSEGMYGCGR